MTVPLAPARMKRFLAARCPLIWRCGRLFQRRVVGPMRRTLCRTKGRIRGIHADPFATYWMSPCAIKDTIYGPEDVPSPATVSALIKGGDWDKQTLPVEELAVVRGARERFVHGMPWEHTAYYQDALNRVSGGQRWRGCACRRDLDEYFRRFDRLYHQIRTDGYKAQSAIRARDWDRPSGVEHEVTVHIDRDGRYLFCDGRHRLAIALALGIERIPVKVCIRHADWHAFCREILGYAKRHGGRVLQPLTHPDLQSLPSTQGEERFEMIRAWLPQDKGRLTVLGAHWGFFCHRLEPMGFNCCAIESDPENLYFMRKLARAQDRRFKIVEDAFRDVDNTRHADVVLALNSFHHFLRTSQLHNRLCSWLRWLDAPLLFLESPGSLGPGSERRYGPCEPDEFVRLILEHSRLNQAACIGTTSDGARMYRLWDSTRTARTSATTAEQPEFHE